jgi:hypothetical protein
MPRTIIGNTVDPVTGLTQRGGAVRVTQNGLVRVTQSTGFAPGSLNTAPGSLTPAPAGQSITLPYGFLTIPVTGDLV